MATKLSTQLTAGNLPRVNHAGANIVTAVYNAGGLTLSVSDTIQMVRIPHGAIISEVKVSGNIPGQLVTSIEVGDDGDDDRYGVFSLSSSLQIQRMNVATGHGYQYSLSDDLEPRYDTIDMTVAATATPTVTCSLVLSVTYYMAPI